MNENRYQSNLIRKLKQIFSGCVVLKNDANYIQGIPDLTILYKDRWATLECKKSEKESRQPNQEYYVEKMNEMSYSRFIYPENKEEVLSELREKFKK